MASICLAYQVVIAPQPEIVREPVSVICSTHVESGPLTPCAVKVYAVGEESSV
jgi:hypothetical protein